jgi:hypothetical protein
MVGHVSKLAASASVCGGGGEVGRETGTKRVPMFLPTSRPTFPWINVWKVSRQGPKLLCPGLVDKTLTTLRRYASLCWLELFAVCLRTSKCIKQQGTETASYSSLVIAFPSHSMLQTMLSARRKPTTPYCKNCADGTLLIRTDNCFLTGKEIQPPIPQVTSLRLLQYVCNVTNKPFCDEM